MNCRICGSLKVKRVVGARMSIILVSDEQGANFEFAEVVPNFDMKDIIKGTEADECFECGEELK